MKRGAMIAIAVLVPFVLLIAIGFSLLKDPPPVELPPLPARVALAPLPEPPPQLERPAPLAVPRAPPPPSPPTLPAEDPPPEVLEALARKPALATVERRVRQCFDDAKDRVREPQRVTVTYAVTDGGHFEDVVIVKSSWPDPQVTACVVDSFEAAQFESPARPSHRQSYTFTFSPAAAGR